MRSNTDTTQCNIWLVVLTFFTDYIITISKWITEHSGHLWVLVDVSDLRSCSEKLFCFFFFSFLPSLLQKFSFILSTFSLHFLLELLLLFHHSFHFLRIATTSTTSLESFNFFFEFTNKFVSITLINLCLILNVLDLVGVSEGRKSFVIIDIGW